MRFSKSSEQEIKAVAKQKASIGSHYTKTLTNKMPKTDKLNMKTLTNNPPNTNKLITNTLAKKPPKSTTLKTPGSSKGAESPFLIHNRAAAVIAVQAARATQHQLDKIFLFVKEGLT
jgi:hypothetical protein